MMPRLSMRRPQPSRGATAGATRRIFFLPRPVLVALGLLSALPVAGCRKPSPPAAAPDLTQISTPELEIRASSGRDARALRELAYRAMQDGKPGAALAHLRRALEIEPSSSDAYNIRGMLQAQGGRIEEATASFERASELAPQKAGPRLNLGKLYLERKQYHAAAEALQKALEADPDNAEAAVLAGDAWRLARSSVAAKRYYRKALELRPDEARAHAGLGEVLTNTGRPAEAIEQLSRALALGDDSSRTRGYLGLAYATGIESQDDARRAQEHLAAAYKAGERDSHVYYGLGLAHMALHDYQGAERILLEGVRAHPDVAGLFYTLADVYAATGRQQQSRAARAKSAALAALRQEEEMFVEAITADPKDTSRFLKYTDWLMARGDHARAVPLLQQVLRLDRGNKRAARDLQRALKTPPRAGSPDGEIAE
jgi:uncharacterized protein (TIGR02996 family)